MDHEEPGCSTSWQDVVGGSARKPREKEEKSRECSLCHKELGNLRVENRESHWLRHAGFLDSPTSVACPTCYCFVRRDEIKQHIQETHPDVDPTIYDDNSFDITFYTSKTAWMNPLVEVEDEAVKQGAMSIHGKSKFTQSEHLNEKRIDGFKSFLKKKLTESPDDLSIPFCYKIYRATKEWPVQWCCPYCNDEESATLMTKFRNNISMRIYAIRHLQTHCDEREGLARRLEKELKYLRKELHEDIAHHFESDRDLGQKHRSVSYYCRNYNDSMASLACEMVRRGGDQEIVPQNMVICLVCFNPVFKGPTRHFHRYHPELEVHSDETEFRCVPEIANCLHTRETFIPTFFSYSKVFRIKEADDSESAEFWKWRCSVTCSDKGHNDDVQEFPSVKLLRLYVMKHIQKYHLSLFHQDFLEREWKMVHNEFKLPVNFRTYCATQEDSFSFDNPTEFCVPFLKKMVTGNRIALDNFKLCGFCFWCGPQEHFCDHILQHSYVHTGEELMPNSQIFKLYDKVMSKKKDYVAEKIGEPTPRILSKAGAKMVKKMFRKAAEAESLHNKNCPPIQQEEEEPAAEATEPTLPQEGNSAESLINKDCPPTQQEEKEPAADAAEPISPPEDLIVEDLEDEIDELEIETGDGEDEQDMVVEPAASQSLFEQANPPDDQRRSAESLLGTDNEETQDCLFSQQVGKEDIGEEHTFDSITSGEIVTPHEDSIVDGLEDFVGGLEIAGEGEIDQGEQPPLFQDADHSPDVFADEEHRYSRDGTPIVRLPAVDETQTPSEASPRKLTSLASIEQSIDVAIEVQKRTKKSVKSNEFVEETPSEGEEGDENAESEVGESLRTSKRRTAAMARQKTQKQMQGLQSSDSSDSGDSDSEEARVDLDEASDDEDDEVEEDEDMSTFVPRNHPGLVSPKAELMRFLARNSEENQRLPSPSVTPKTTETPLDWEAKVKENFDYDEEEPPVTSSLVRALEKLKLMKCPFCNITIKRSRISSASNSDEESVLAHLMVAHSEQSLVKDILCRKWYKLSHSKDDPSVIPTIFLLNPENMGLVCSSCTIYKCDRLYTLRVHFATCIQKTLAPPPSADPTPSTRGRQPGNSHGCPMDCGIRWKISKLYNAQVSEITHLIANHFGDKTAYAKGKEIDEQHELGAQFPFLDVAESWNRSGDGMKLVCSKCGHEVKRLAELVQHAERTHERLDCPFGCQIRKVRGDMRTSAVVVHVMTHLPDPDALLFLSSSAVTEKTESYPFDLSASIANIMAEEKRPITCKNCEKRFGAERFRLHLSSDCFDNVTIKVKIKLNSKKEASAKVQEEIPDTPKKGKSKKKEDMVECPICKRWFTKIQHVSGEISILAHMLSRHRDRLGEELLSQWKPEEIRHQPPHIDLQLSIEASKNLAAGCVTLVCAFCKAKCSSMRNLSDHYRGHGEILQYSELEEPCEGCNKEIPSYGVGDEKFYRLAHILEHHVTDEQPIDTPILPDKTLAPFLDGEASISESVDNSCSSFRCAKCPHTAATSLAFLHHYSEHHCATATSKAMNYSCPVCRKSCPSCNSYGLRVSMLAHFIRCHPDSKETFVASFGTEWSSKEYPFLDAERSLDTRKFVCSVCDKELSAINAILRHVAVHHGVNIPKLHPSPSIARVKRSSAGMDETENTPKKRPRMAAVKEEGDENIENSIDDRSTIFDDCIASAGEDEGALCTPVTQTRAKKGVPIYRQTATPSPSLLTIHDIERDSDDPYSFVDRTPISSLVSTPKSTPMRDIPTRASQRRQRCAQMYSSSQSSNITNWLTPGAGGSNLTPQNVAVVIGGSSTTASEMNLKDVLNDSLSGTPTSSRKGKDHSSIFSALPQTRVAEIVSSKAPVDVSHMDIGGFKCSMCHFVGMSKRDINAHLRHTHADEISNKRDLDTPRSVVTACCVCEEVFGNRKKLMAHIEQSHKMEAAPYPCAFCGKCFSTHGRMREHERRVHEQGLKALANELTCKHCDAVFGNPRNLKEHEKRHAAGNQLLSERRV